MLIDVLGVVCLVVLLVFIFWMDEYNTFLFQGGLVVSSLLTAVLIGTIVQPGSRLGGILAWKPFKWIGQRSYGIYLWHFPVIIISSTSSDFDGIYWPKIILQVLVTVGLAAVSYRWIENPIRYGRITRSIMVKSSVAILVGVLLLILPNPHDGTASNASVKNTAKKTIKITQEPSPLPAQKNRALLGDLNPTPDMTKIPKPSSNLPSTPEPEPKQNPKPNPASKPAPAPKPAPKPNPTPNQKTNPTPNPAPNQLPKPNPTPNPSLEGIQVTAIGDSVMLNLEPYLKQLIPGIVVDGKVSRQLVKAPPVVYQLKSEGKLGNVVVIELGTNGPFTYGQLENLYQTLGNPKKVIFVNTRVPRRWESVVNTTLAKFVASTPNTILVDWYTNSANQNDYFVQDGVHLTRKGALALAGLINEAVRNGK